AGVVLQAARAAVELIAPFSRCYVPHITIQNYADLKEAVNFCKNFVMILQTNLRQAIVNTCAKAALQKLHRRVFPD
ncbi:MAG: hypothetical protein OSB26_16695, partial [Woeseiaceae bacterium]|nr:hypothetical protein [Woeseiaceae bacterium]